MIKLKKKTVQRVFIFFLLYLPLQYALVGVFGLLISEPWPAFALPGFKNVHTAESQTKVVRPHFYARVNNKSGYFQEVQVSEYKLFDGIKESQMQGFIRTHFSEQKLFSNDGRQWLQDRVEQIYPESESNELKVVWREITYTQKADKLTIEFGEDVKVITISFTERR